MLQSKNLVYTGVTRAKDALHIIFARGESRIHEGQWVAGRAARAGQVSGTQGEPTTEALASGFAPPRAASKTPAPSPLCRARTQLLRVAASHRRVPILKWNGEGRDSSVNPFVLHLVKEAGRGALPGAVKHEMPPGWVLGGPSAWAYWARAVRTGSFVPSA
jgi:hypothetical protein